MKGESGWIAGSAAIFRTSSDNRRSPDNGYSTHRFRSQYGWHSILVRIQAMIGKEAIMTPVSQTFYSLTLFLALSCLLIWSRRRDRAVCSRQVARSATSPVGAR